jgi:NTP pyrophosphatase (non-canonical NTP hydrolase)
VITEKVADFILDNLKESQFAGAGKFVYLAKLKNKFSIEIVEEAEEVSKFDLIRAWAGARGIYTDGNSKTQLVKLMEEVGETSKAILKDDRSEIKDGIGDCVVVLTNLAHLCGLTIEECIDAAYSEIKDRKGEMKNQTFVKQQ